MIQKPITVTSYNFLTYPYSLGMEVDGDRETILDNKKRHQKIKDKLDQFIQNNSIILMQEISQTFAGDLQSFYAQKNYKLITSLYDSPRSDYMGVGIAFPNSLFNLQQCSIQRLSDNKKWVNPNPQKNLIFRLFDNIFYYLTLQFLWRKKSDKYGFYKQAQNRQNRAIFMKLKDNQDGSDFCVANYHMPCAFYDRRIMNIHLALLCQGVQKFSGDLPFILGGDFNTTPVESGYDLILNGKTDREDFRDFPKDDLWKPEHQLTMKSAYKEFFGKEPDVTNVSKRVEDKEIFAGCLDYLFFNQKFDVINAMQPYKIRPNLLPNSEEPSDHLAIQCSFKKNNN